MYSERVLYDTKMEVFQSKMTYLLKRRKFEYMSEYAYFEEEREMMTERMDAPPEADNVSDNNKFLAKLADKEALRVRAHNDWVATTKEIAALRAFVSGLPGRNVSIFGSPINATHGRARVPEPSSSGTASPRRPTVPRMTVNLGNTSAAATRNKKHTRNNQGNNDNEREEGSKIGRIESPEKKHEDIVEDINGGISDSEIANIPDENEKKDEQISNSEGA